MSLTRTLSLIGLGLFNSACANQAEEPPLAIVFVIDTLRYDGLGCNGAAGDPTPNIDALAADGTRFEQAISSSGWTLPSVASLLTGTWPAIHKAQGKKARLTPISEDVPTAQELLQRAGFRTGAVANATFLSPLLGLDRGFDEFDHKPAFNVDIRRADASVAAALAQIDANKDQAQFMLVHLFDPHLDYDPSDESFPSTSPSGELTTPIDLYEIRECITRRQKRKPAAKDIRYIRDAYQSEVSAVDAAFGQFCEALKEMGRYDDALIVVTADHGEEFWEHFGFEHGHTLYDELVRVPLVVKLPKSDVAPIPMSDTPVRVLDVMPTIFAQYGVEPSAFFEGTSLAPIMKGDTRAGRVAFCESTLYGPDLIALRGERYKFIIDVRGGEHEREELYDWRNDPDERQNLVPTRPDLAREARAELDRFRAELEQKSAQTRRGELKDVSPRTMAEYQQSLESLGYAGRDEGESSEEE